MSKNELSALKLLRRKVRSVGLDTQVIVTLQTKL